MHHLNESRTLWQNTWPTFFLNCCPQGFHEDSRLRGDLKSSPPGASPCSGPFISSSQMPQNKLFALPWGASGSLKSSGLLSPFCFLTSHSLFIPWALTKPCDVPEKSLGFLRETALPMMPESLSSHPLPNLALFLMLLGICSAASVCLVSQT